MDKLLTRKQFFREVAHQTVKLTADLLTNETTSPEVQTAINLNSLAADLSPELLAMEADRLGLDPNNPQQVIDTLNSALQKADS